MIPKACAHERQEGLPCPVPECPAGVYAGADRYVRQKPQRHGDGRGLRSYIEDMHAGHLEVYHRTCIVINVAPVKGPHREYWLWVKEPQ